MKNKISNIEIVVTVIIGIVVNIVGYAVAYAVNLILQYQLDITVETAGTYGGILTGVMSIVFITTSLLSMLSDKSDTTYWTQTVQYILVNPKYRNFYSLSTYSFVSLGASALGMLLCKGELMISGATLSVLVIVWIFYKMTRIYFKKEVIKEQLKKEFLNEINTDKKEPNEAVRESLEEKIRVTVINTLVGVENKDLGIINDNLSLLFNAPKNGKITDEINTYIVEIYRKIYEENHFMLMTALELYKKTGVICDLNEFIVKIIDEQYETNEDVMLKDYLCELYIDKMLQLEKMKMPKGDLNQNFKKCAELKKNTVPIPKALAKAFFKCHGDLLKDNLMNILQKINDCLYSINRTTVENFYFYLLDEFLKNKPNGLMEFIDKTIDYSEVAHINGIVYRKASYSMNDIDEDQYEEYLNEEEIDQSTVSYYLRSLFLSVSSFEPSSTVKHAKEDSDKRWVLEDCLDTIIRRTLNYKRIFTIEEQNGEDKLRINDNLRFIMKYLANRKVRDAYHHFEIVGNYLKQNDIKLDENDLIELARYAEKSYVQMNDLINDDYLEVYDEAVQKKIKMIFWGMESDD